MKSIRDFYRKDVDEILADTKDAHKRVREIMLQLSKSSVKKVKLYKNDDISLFNAFNIEAQVLDIMSPRVNLPSGGSIVIGQTEALVAIDINSGRATKERHIDTTALKTNLEATKEIARQIRLRDLSGLIVIDFIDMSNQKHVQQVERAFNSELLNDNARVQVSNISQFGLLEMSRQRLRSSLTETYCETCSCCKGRGVTYSRTYFLSTILHFLEKVAFESCAGNAGAPADPSKPGTLDGATSQALASTSEPEEPQRKVITVRSPQSVCYDLLNKKRKEIVDIEQKNNCVVTVDIDNTLSDTSFIINCGNGADQAFSLEKNNEEEKEEERPHHKVQEFVGAAPSKVQNRPTTTDRRNPFRLHKRKRMDNGKGTWSGTGHGQAAEEQSEVFENKVASVSGMEHNEGNGGNGANGVAGKANFKVAQKQNSNGAVGQIAKQDSDKKQTEEVSAAHISVNHGNSEVTPGELLHKKLEEKRKNRRKRNRKSHSAVVAAVVIGIAEASGNPPKEAAPGTEHR
jgi:hypothetical protein